MSLPKPGDPLVTASGLVIVDDAGQAQEVSYDEYQEGLIVQNFKKFVPAFEQDLATMPEADKQEQTIIAAVIGLRLIGLDLNDIATCMNTSISAITEIIEKPATQASFELAFQSLVNVNSKNVQGRIAAHADNAVSTVVRLMNDINVRPDVQLKAAQDVLDRSGTSEDVVFGKHKADRQLQDDDLNIVYMSEGDEASKVEINISKRTRK